MIDESRISAAMFPTFEREGVYKTILARRDVRRFVAAPVDQTWSGKVAED